MASKIRFLNRFKNYQIISASLVIIAVALIGSLYLLSSHAASTLGIGVFEGYGNSGGVASFASETKTPVNIAADYLDGTSWSSIDSPDPAALWTGTPYTLQLGVDMLPNSGASLANGANGSYNQYFKTLAQNLVNAGEGNAILHIGWEWDQGNPWAVSNTTDATNFAAYWRQIVTTMRAVPGANFNYSWYYGANNGTGPSATTTAAYPGSAYVSSIDLDFYDQTWDGSCGLAFNNTANSTQSQCIWNDNLVKVLNGYASFASQESEPMGFGEWGVISRSDGHGLGDDPTFVNNFANWVKTHNVNYISYFDFNSGGDSILSHYPQSLAAYTANFSSTGSGGGGGGVVNPPSAPTSVTATPNNPTSVTVSWQASTDTGGPGIKDYNVLRAIKGGTFAPLATVTGTSYTDTTVSANTSYSYEIVAVDNSNPALSSNPSAAALVTMPAYPLTPTGVSAVANSATSVTVSWQAVTGVKGYNVFRGGVQVNSSTVTGTSYTDTSVVANTSYSYTVKAVDIYGDISNPSSAASVTTPSLPSDTTPPSVPAGLKVTNNTATSVSFSWTASSDNTGGSGLKGYYVLRSTNGTSYSTLAPTTSTSYTDNTVAQATTYYYEVEAFDVAGNVSASSTALKIATPSSTPTAPAAPVLTATAVSSSQINLSWTESTPGVTGYAVFSSSGQGLALLAAPTSSYGITGLTANTTYSYYVLSSNGTLSPKSNIASATTLAAPPSQNYATGPITGLAGKCIDNYYSQKVNYNKIDLWDCNGTGAQRWTYNPNNGTIVNSNGYCLDVYADHTTSGTLVDLYQCNGTSAQVWSVKGAPGKPGAIVNPHSGLCLDDKYSGTNNGNQIWIYTCNGTGAQRWTVN